MPEFAQHEELARAALAEITPVDGVGAYMGTVDEDGGAVSLLFEAAMLGYPGWRWTVSIATVEGSEPTVLEAELMPGDGALLAPDWVPWSERLAEYKAAQEAEAVANGDESAEDESGEDESDDDDSDESEDFDDESDDDDDEDDVLGNDVLHGGDLDGIDIDALDEPADDDESDDDESDEDDDDESDGDDESDEDSEAERTY